MTTIVSRLYESAEVANRVADTLREDGFPDRTISVITSADKAAILAARVDEGAADRYAKVMTGGRTLFVCRAPFSPFGAARRAMDVADSVPSLDAGVSNENRYVAEEAQLENLTPSVLINHPTMMTRDDYVGSGWADWSFSGIFLWPTIVRRREVPNNIYRGGRHMSQKFWPQKLISDKPRRSSVIEGGRHILSSKRPVSTPTKRSVLTNHPRITEKFGWKTISERT
jgi:hypothetical protein